MSKCKFCGISLFENINWYRTDVKTKNYRCKPCRKKKALEKAPALNAKAQGIKWHPKVSPRKLWEFQNHCCWLCGAKQEDRVLHRDHNHHTGWIRGLLCANCNHRLPSKYCDGSLDDARAYLESQNCFSSEYVDKCIDYLDNPPYFKMMELWFQIERPKGTYEEFINSREGAELNNPRPSHLDTYQAADILLPTSI